MEARPRPAPEPEDSGPTPPRKDAGRDARPDVGTDAWGGAGACNDLVSNAPFLNAVQVAQPLPTMTGGAVDPGTYELTKIEFFQGGDGDAGPPDWAESETWRIGSLGDAGYPLESATAVRYLDGGIARGRSSRLLTLDSRVPFVATLTRFCPGPGKLGVDFAYTATGTGTGATFAYTFTSYPIVYTYTKR